MRKEFSSLLALSLFAFFISACSESSIGGAGDDSASDADSDSDGDSDSDADTDSASDLDSDIDTDSDADSDADTDADSDMDTDADSDSDSDSDPYYPDEDGDGWVEGIDCDDENPDVNQGADEIYDPPNNVDDDCDGLTDEEPYEPDAVTFSYIWIANSDQGTVSKIDTRTLEELGRYWVRPDHAGTPSRTSVNLDGDMAVAARNAGGGVTKFYSTLDKCQESNGQPGIQTSTGPTDILDWDVEECRAWHTPFDYFSMRALAWTTDGKVWTSGSLAASDTDETAPIEVLLLDGETGEVEQTIEIDTADAASGSHGHGAYGGVVDGRNNFWIVQIYSQKLIKVDYTTFTYETWNEPVGSYGIAFDSEGHIWTCNESVARFNPLTGLWDTAFVATAPYYNLAGGCMADGNGILWNSIGDTLYAIDTQTLGVLDQITTLPGVSVDGTDSYWGVALDVDGFVWTIPRYGSQAFKVNPADHTYETVGGLVGAYTYSDMTGYALQIADDVQKRRGAAGRRGE